MMIFLTILSPLSAQKSNDSEISPRGAFLRSLAVPGWGHYYADNTDWKQGQYHLAADVVMVLSYTGISVRSNMLENDLETFALSRAETDLSGRGRSYLLAVSSFNSLDEYNDFQIRARNWDNLIADTPENQWSWNSLEDRARFQDMREQVDRNNNQLPTIITLMVANRVISGLSAFVKARNRIENMPEASFSYLNEFGRPGVTAHVRIPF